MTTTDRALSSYPTFVLASAGIARGVVQRRQIEAAAAVRLQTPEPPTPTEIPPIEPPDPSGPPLDPPMPDMPPIGDPPPGRDQPMGASRASVGSGRHVSYVQRSAGFRRA